MAQKKTKDKAPNPFIESTEHYGAMTVRQLVELVETDEFPRGLDTRIRIGDVEGNMGTVSEVTVTAHGPDDIVLAIDTNSGDMDYDVT